jgi:XTP/dITP diphosphohydrolase
VKRHHLFLASRNAHKTREFRQMLGAEFILQDLRTHPEIGQVVEDGATFAENARLKAVAISRQLPGLILADDSGLEVESLGGAPGVYSARYAGKNATDEMNRRKLLDEMAQLTPGSSRAARFRCVLALARSGEVLATFEGSAKGRITSEPRGDGDFGYDPLFQPNEVGQTFAELRPAEKNTISHRALAVAQLKSFLRTTHLAEG